MLAETDFHKRKNLMSIIVQGRYYNTSNSAAVESNYLTLCGLRFPLVRGRTLIEEEQSYVRKNDKTIQQLKAAFEKEIDANGKTLDELKREVDTKEDVAFFISNICVPHARTSKPIEEKQTRILYQSNEPIFPTIINKNCAIINGRVYPLNRVSEPVFANLDNANYTIGSAETTVDGIESKFQNILMQRIRAMAINNSKKSKEFLDKTRQLDEKILSLETVLKVAKHAYSYEFGDLGYDTQIGSVYWLIEPHYNKTTGRNYSEGQSAATLKLTNKQLGTTGIFAERDSRNQPFVCVTSSHCMGFGLVGTTLEDKMQYLKTFASVVKRNGAIHE